MSYKIGILGGTFDPVHLGHLTLAEAATQALSLDDIQLIPCKTPVHKQQACASSTDRVAMLSLALENQPNCHINTVEIDRDTPSYTTDTLNTLQQENPASALFFILGSDALQTFDTWHEWKTILQQVTLMVAARPGVEIQIPPLLQPFHEKIITISADCPDISSTQVKQRLTLKQNVNDFLPEKVLNYIHQHHLYGV